MAELQRHHAAADDLLNFTIKAHNDISAIHLKLQQEFQRIYPDNANPMKLLDGIKKIEDDLLLLRDQCRDLLAAKQNSNKDSSDHGPFIREASTAQDDTPAPSISPHFTPLTSAFPTVSAPFSANGVVAPSTTYPSTVAPTLNDDGILDYTPCFGTKQVFRSREEAITWARGIGSNYKMVLVIKNSTQKPGTLARVNLVCDRYGKSRAKKCEIRDPGPIRGTRKCECPFQLQCAESAYGGWQLSVWNGVHLNHTLYDQMERSPYATRPTAAQAEHIKALTKTHMKPKQIEDSLKATFSGFIPTIEQIRALRKKLKADEKGDMNWRMDNHGE